MRIDHIDSHLQYYGDHWVWSSCWKVSPKFTLLSIIVFRVEIYAYVGRHLGDFNLNRALQFMAILHRDF